MSLKRKASFSAMAPMHTMPVVAGPSRRVEDSSKHLHSRTRKRYRNDRPDEKVVYENTLRWLFDAQKSHHGPLPPIGQDDGEDEDMDEDTLPPSEITDPRQQTLHRFFQPTQSSFPHRRLDSKRQSDYTPQSKDSLPREYNYNMLSPATSTESGPNGSGLRITGDDISMEIESSSDNSIEESKRWVGGFAWI